MKEFEIFVNNRPGELARVTEALASNGVNIVAIASERTDKPIIRIVTDDEQTTRSALERGKFKFKEEGLMILDLIDRPGELAKVAKKLAKAGINIESIYILGKSQNITRVAIIPSNKKRAREALR